eukprot:1158959-Pelagomonas_calceolata.AAC.4
MEAVPRSSRQLGAGQLQEQHSDQSVLVSGVVVVARNTIKARTARTVVKPSLDCGVLLVAAGEIQRSSVQGSWGGSKAAVTPKA